MSVADLFTAESFGLLTGTRAFCADVEQIMDRDSHVAPGDRVHLMCIYKVPENISPEQYGKGFSRYFDDFAALPSIQKNCVKIQTLFQNSAVDAHIDKVGYSQPEPTFIAHIEFETWDNLIRRGTTSLTHTYYLFFFSCFFPDKYFQLQTEEAQKLTLAANRNFGLNNRGCIYTADLVTKI
ncbi:hypothetical protein K438DRAFT_1979410 [Mycena galopus ATCC 62051]|nr:hypothetical protein K438DRAFT_1979410 [Mycena galopus ATCC 62051]